MTEKQVCALWSWLQNEAAQKFGLTAILSPFEIRKTVFSNEGLQYERLIAKNCFKNRASSTKEVSFSSLQSSPWEFVTTNPKHQDLLIQFIFSKDGFLKNSDKLIRSLSDLALRENFETFLTGDGLVEKEIEEGLQRDLGLNGLLLLVLFLLFNLFYKDAKASVLLTLSLVLSSLILAGIISLAGIKLNLLTNGIFLICSVAALQDFIFIYREKMRSPRKTLDEVLKHLRVPCFLTTLTTLLGFGSLAISDIHIIREFGILAALGSLVEFMVLFCLIPSLWKKLQIKDNAKARFEGYLYKLEHMKMSKSLFLLSICLFLAAPLTFLDFEAEKNPLSAFTDKHQVSKGQSYLEDNRLWRAKGYIVFDKVLNDEDFVYNKNLINNIEPSIHLLDSEQAYLSHFTQGLEESYRKLVSTEVKSSFYFSQYRSNQDTTVLPIYLSQLNPEILAQFKNNFESLCKPSCTVRGSSFDYALFSKKIVPTLLSSFLLSLSLILLFLVLFSWHWLRQIPWNVILCSLWGAVVTSGLYLTFPNMEVNYLTSIAAAVLVGITGDNAIHFIYGARVTGIKTAVQVKFFDCLAITILTAAGASVLLFSSFTYPRTLGVVLSLGFLLSFVGDVWLLKTWIDWDSREKTWSRQNKQVPAKDL